jgi:class 3 adenylate cyclase
VKSNHIPYNFDKSRERINNILNTTDKSFEEVESIPSRDKLTFNNGFYVNKTAALFVDIRNSSDLPVDNQRPVLARIYRVFISEVVAIINGNENCAEIGIDGDCVWGIFDAAYKNKIDSIFSTVAQIGSIIEYINWKFKKEKIYPLSIGIGISYGRVLMIKAGYQGSSINEVVWMGDVMNDASKLCSYGNKSFNDEMLMISEDFQLNLNDHNKSLLAWNSNRGCYHGNVGSELIIDWMVDNCK